jgi:hypothetical protein
MSAWACPTREPIELLLRSILGRISLLAHAAARAAQQEPSNANTSPLSFDAASAGRRPAGLLSRSRDLGHSRLGDFLAHCSHLEAARVLAFERLACELNAHGAPLDLVDEAINARGDEVRHALLLSQLARKYSGEPTRASVANLALRPLAEIARENVVEGCVRETYGALVAGYQAEHAHDTRLRVVMAEIAQDEARHAGLSHRVQRWIVPQLSRTQREAARHAQQRAVFELAREVARPLDPEVRLAAGLPSAALGRLLLCELSRALFNPRAQKQPREALG